MARAVGAVSVADPGQREDGQDNHQVQVAQREVRVGGGDYVVALGEGCVL